MASRPPLSSTSSSSLLPDSDILNAKIFLRTYNDAIDCAQQIASRESQRDHYKSYVKTLLRSLREDKLMIDKTGAVIVAEDPQVANIYSLLQFS